MNIEIANRLQKLRKENGYSQEELADKLGISRQAVSKWERAESSPDTDNLIILARLYNMSLDDLLYDSESNEEIRNRNIDKEEAKKENNESNEDNSNEKSNSSNENGKYEKSGVHITDDGIHINSGKEGVHITDEGIHIVDDEGQSVIIGDDGIRFRNKDGSYEHMKKGRIFLSIMDSIVFSLTLIGFIVWGACFDGWSLCWILWILMPAVMSMFEAIYKKQITKFVYPCLVTAIYLFVGMKYDMWHPLWVLFLTIPLFYIIFEPIDKYVIKSKPINVIDCDCDSD